MCVLYHSSVCWEIWFHSIQLLVTQILSVSWLWNPQQWTSNLSVKAEIMESHEDAFLTICWNSIDSLLTYRHNQNSIKNPKTNQKVALKIWSLGCQENVFGNHEEQPLPELTLLIWNLYVLFLFFDMYYFFYTWKPLMVSPERERAHKFIQPSPQLPIYNVQFIVLFTSSVHE